MEPTLAHSRCLKATALHCSLDAWMAAWLVSQPISNPEHGEQFRNLLDHVLQVGTREARSSPCQDHRIDIGTNDDFLHVMDKDLSTSTNIRERDRDMPVKTPWSDEGPSSP